MTIKDIGPEPQFLDLERETVDNINYRTVAWSGKYLQLTLMSIPEGGDIGLEMHPRRISSCAWTLAMDEFKWDQPGTTSSSSRRSPTDGASLCRPAPGIT
jgi:hypothetical protein